jgi:hypothetical protein
MFPVNASYAFSNLQYAYVIIGEAYIEALSGK